jgi:hypothetical protein
MSHDVIPNLKTALENHAESMYARRLHHLQNAESILGDQQGPIDPYLETARPSRNQRQNVDTPTPARRDRLGPDRWPRRLIHPSLSARTAARLATRHAGRFSLSKPWSALFRLATKVGAEPVRRRGRAACPLVTVTPSTRSRSWRTSPWPPASPPRSLAPTRRVPGGCRRLPGSCP